MKKILCVFFLLLSITVTAQPQLEGGLESFINSNLKYPRYSFRNCIEGKVTVAFKLNKKGEVSQARVQSGVGTDLDDEALRLIRKTSGKWKLPAGYNAWDLLVVPVNFTINGDDCLQKSKADRQQAVAAYAGQKALTDAILNFYKHRQAGKGDKGADEARYIALKQELGYDEAYMEDRIDDGRDKLKQGDTEGACEDFLFVRHMGFNLADDLIQKHCNKARQ